MDAQQKPRFSEATGLSGRSRVFCGRAYRGLLDEWREQARRVRGTNRSRQPKGAKRVKGSTSCSEGWAGRGRRPARPVRIWVDGDDDTDRRTTVISMLVEKQLRTAPRLAAACSVIGLTERTCSAGDQTGRWPSWSHPVLRTDSPTSSAARSSPLRRARSSGPVAQPDRAQLADRALPRPSRRSSRLTTPTFRVTADARDRRRADLVSTSQTRAPGRLPPGHHHLRSYVRGSSSICLVEDVWSRKIVGWEVHNIESADRAAELVERIRITTDVDLAGWVLHSDNGSPMKGATMLATLQRLGVVPSFSRPSVSDDNPYSEALFRTLKYCPEYPSTGFATVADARAGSRVRRYSLRAQAQRYRLSRRPSVTAASISDPRPAHASAGVLGDGIQERWASATGLVAMTTVTQPGGGSPHERDHP